MKNKWSILQLEKLFSPIIFRPNNSYKKRIEMKIKIGNVILWNWILENFFESQEGSEIICGQKGSKHLNFGRVGKAGLEDSEK